MNKDFRNYVATCEACQKSISKMEKTFPELHPILVPTKLWHQIGVNLCILSKNPEVTLAYVFLLIIFQSGLNLNLFTGKNAEEVA